MSNCDQSSIFPAGGVDRKLYANRGNEPLLRLMPESARRILDVGCGAGDNARMLTASGRSVDGITLSQAEADSARSACHNVFVHDLETGLPLNLAPSYDAVVCSHVLEHLRWPDRLLAEIREILLPRGGVLMVALPNMLFYKNRWRIAAGYFDYEESGLMDASHFRWFTYSTSRRLLEGAGFDIVCQKGDGSFPLPLLRVAIGRPAASFLDTVAVQMMPGLFAYQILLMARPKTPLLAKEGSG